MIVHLLAMLASAVPQPGELKTYSDWTVGCDNVRSCHATSLMPEGGDWDRMLAMNIKRDAGPDAPPRIALLAVGATVGALRADGARLAVRLNQDDEEYRVDPRDAPAMLAALRSARTISVEDGEGGEIGTVSLAGVSAALLYIDEQQKRIDTRTALVRPGSRPGADVPAAPPLPVVRSAAGAGSPVALDDARIDALRKDHDCLAEDPDWPGYDSALHVLDAQHGLLLLGCGAGAYNYSSVPFVVSLAGGGVAIALAAFDLPPRWSEQEGKPSLVNADWGEGLLTSFAKGRGIGDCGIGSDYAWDGERFRLVEQVEMGECRGSLDYITTWRAEVVKE